MRRIRRDSLIKRTAGILRDNAGASLLLVSIMAIIVLTAVVILRVSTSTFLASSSRQLNQDQAYELAASLGESIDILIERGDFDIQKVNVTDPNGIVILSETTIPDGSFVGLPRPINSEEHIVQAVVTDLKDKESNIIGKRLTVTAKVGKAEYIYSKDYRK